MSELFFIEKIRQQLKLEGKGLSGEYEDLLNMKVTELYNPPPHLESIVKDRNKLTKFNDEMVDILRKCFEREKRNTTKLIKVREDLTVPFDWNENYQKAYSLSDKVISGILQNLFIGNPKWE